MEIPLAYENRPLALLACLIAWFAFLILTFMIVGGLTLLRSWTVRKSVTQLG